MRGAAGGGPADRAGAEADMGARHEAGDGRDTGPRPAPGGVPGTEALLAAALRAESAGTEGERRALAAFRAARDAEPARAARTRRRDDWRPRDGRHQGRTPRTALSVLLASLTLGGVAYAAMGGGGSASDDGGPDRTRPPAVSDDAPARPAATPPGTTPGPGTTGPATTPPGASESPGTSAPPRVSTPPGPRPSAGTPRHSAACTSGWRATASRWTLPPGGGWSRRRAVRSASRPTAPTSSTGSACRPGRDRRPVPETAPAGTTRGTAVRETPARKGRRRDPRRRRRRPGGRRRRHRGTGAGPGPPIGRWRGSARIAPGGRVCAGNGRGRHPHRRGPGRRAARAARRPVLPSAPGVRFLSHLTASRVSCILYGNARGTWTSGGFKT